MVSDTGVGISREAQSRLFESFSQADESMTRRFGGSGLGLAICRQLVGLMQGEIGVDSEPDQGARFWFTVDLGVATALPSTHGAATHVTAAHVTAAPTTADRLTGPASNGQDLTAAQKVTAPAFAPPPAASHPSANPLPPLNAHLLLAEDNPVNQLVARHMLTGFGCTVEVVDDGEKALEAVQRTRFDGVLMDCQMPVMDGCTATVAIRAWEAGDPSRQPLVIVALTANAMAEDRAACLAAGMDEHLSKPYRRDQIHATLQRLLPRKEAA